MVQKGRLTSALRLAALLVAGQAATALATGVPIDGFLPMVGISLTREFVADISIAPEPSDSMSGPQLGAGGTPYYGIALMDTGAAVSLLNTPGGEAFGIHEPYSPGQGGSDGFRGTFEITIGGATGFVDAEISDPLGVYANGLQARTGAGAALTMDTSTMPGQTNTALAVVPPESDLPNVLGLSYVSQYTTRIRGDQPQIFELAGETVRSPAIEFFPRGSGGLGIVRKAPLSLNGQTPVTPQHLPSLADPGQWWEDPQSPSFVSGGLFLNVNLEDDLDGDGGSLTNFEFFFDTGASVTVVSELNAQRLGFDVLLDQPEFTLSVVGSGGTKLDVPGFFVDEFTIQAIGGNIVTHNVPVIVLDIVDPSDPNNVIDGFVGTNLLAGRNLVIDPNPAISGGLSAGLYVSDPVTSSTQWSNMSASGDWSDGGGWSGSSEPNILSIANVRHVAAAGDQSAVLLADGEAWEVNVSGASQDQQMTLDLGDDAKLTTFSGTNIEAFGGLRLNGATLDTQYVQVLDDGFLGGTGAIRTGSGPITGQVENVGGLVSPGDAVEFGTLEIEGRFSNGPGGTLAYTLAGLVPGDDYGQLLVDGDAAFAGTLQVVLEPGFTPSMGNTFELATYNSSVGQFDTLDLPASFAWDLAYTPTSLLLTVMPLLEGDFNGDGVVGAADYVMWRNAYGSTNHPQLDLDSSGTVDDGDYAIWAANFGSSGGGGGHVAGVPEPGSALLWLIALLLAIPKRRWLHAA